MEVVRSRQGAGLCGNCRRRLPQQRNARVAAGPPSSGDLDPDELEEQRQSLERLAMRRTNDSITGPELRQLVEQQFGKPFDTRLTQKRDYFNGLRMYLQDRLFPLNSAFPSRLFTLSLSHLSTLFSLVCQ